MEDLPALTTKIARMLSIRSEYVVTQPAELRILREMTEENLREFANRHGWRVIRRLGADLDPSGWEELKEGADKIVRNVDPQASSDHHTQKNLIVS